MAQYDSESPLVDHARRELALIGEDQDVTDGIVKVIEATRFGAYLVAVRENEDAARAVGIDVVRTKLIAMTISNLTPIPASIQPWSVALGIGITALVGLFFGLYPASRAARLDPIEALRRE